VNAQSALQQPSQKKGHGANLRKKGYGRGQNPPLMKTCPTCSAQVTVLIVNVQNNQRFCHHCAGAVCPTFLPHAVLTQDDVKLLRAMGVDPEVGKIEEHVKRIGGWD